MKKLIPFVVTLAIVLLSMGVVLAPDPCPFLFTVLTSPPDVTGLTLVLTYGSQSWTLLEQVPGEYSIEIGHVGISNCNFQNFDLVIKECEGDSVCHKTVSFNPQGITVLDVRNANLFLTTTTPVTTTTTPYVPECFTSAECAELIDCVEACEKDICKNICEDLGFKYECPEFAVSEEIYQIISGISVIINVILALKVGVGVKATYFKSTSGRKYVGIKSHRHANHPRYHSIYTMHKKEPHKRGEINPSYDNETGKYLGGG